MDNKRKIYIVVAGGGNLAAQKHFEDTIQTKRSLSEIRKYLPESEIVNLKKIYRNAPFIVWGAVPGPSNKARWERMKQGDFILIYNQGFVKLVGEIATKVRSRKLARYLWDRNAEKQTWELLYFIVNEEKVTIPFAKINKLFGYAEHFRPQGFTNVEQGKVDTCIKTHGDLRIKLRRLGKESV